MCQRFRSLASVLAPQWTMRERGFSGIELGWAQTLLDPARVPIMHSKFVINHKTPKYELIGPDK
jgi:hypothetical protein